MHIYNDQGESSCVHSQRNDLLKRLKQHHETERMLVSLYIGIGVLSATFVEMRLRAILDRTATFKSMPGFRGTFDISRSDFQRDPAPRLTQAQVLASFLPSFKFCLRHSSFPEIRLDTDLILP